MTSFGAQSMIAPVRRVLLKHARDAYRDDASIDAEWAALNYASAPCLSEAIEQYDAFVSLLRPYVPQVDFLPADSRTGLDSIYAYDPVLVTERGAIPCNMGKERRRGEADVAGEFLPRLGIPILGRIEPPGTLEAGDVVWFDRETVAVGRGYRTNDEGIRQLRQILGSSVTSFIVVPLPHWLGPAACLHLMGLISLIDTDLAVTYSRALPVFMREWLIDRGYSLIDVSDEEHARLACNVLALAPRRCMMAAGSPVTKRLLEQAGATVIEYDGGEISLKGTGGPTCLTRPLWRA
jgi:N-dimethylarginine dimethylaminohydrolase